MARDRKQGAVKLGERELDLMNALWTLGDASVGEVHETLAEQGVDTAYTTVQTMLNRLVDKRLAARELHGRAYRYSPRLRRPDAALGAVGTLIQRFFGGSAEALARHLVEEDLSEAELERIRRLIERRREEAP